MTSSIPAPVDEQTPTARPAGWRPSVRDVLTSVVVALVLAIILGAWKFGWTALFADPSGSIAVVRAGGMSLEEFRAEQGRTGGDIAVDPEGVRVELTLDTSHTDGCVVRWAFIDLERQRPMGPRREVTEFTADPASCPVRTTVWVPLPQAGLPGQVAVELELVGDGDSLDTKPTRDLGVGGG